MSTDTPNAAASVVVVNVEAELFGLIRETLATEAVLPNSSVEFDEGFLVIERTMPDVVIVGVSPTIDTALTFCADAKEANPQATFIAIADAPNAEDILAAVRGGFNEYLVLPDDVDRLRDVTQNAAQGSDDSERGMVVSVLGAKGGVGGTLVATHLATELAEIHRVICLDNDFISGDIAAMMNLTPKGTVVDLLNRGNKIDERMLTGTVTHHPSKVQFLCQPEDLGRLEIAEGGNVHHLVSAAARAYQYVVVDCGVSLDGPTLSALNQSDKVIIVSTPDVVSVRSAHRKIKLLASYGVDKDKLHLVLNKVPKERLLPTSAIKTNLEIEVHAEIPFDPASADIATNEGKILREVSRRGDLTQQLARLVGLLHSDDEFTETKESTEKQGFLARFFNR